MKSLAQIETSSITASDCCPGATPVANARRANSPNALHDSGRKFRSDDGRTPRASGSMPGVVDRSRVLYRFKNCVMKAAQIIDCQDFPTSFHQGRSIECNDGTVRWARQKRPKAEP